VSIRTSARAIIQRDGKLLVIRYRDEQGDFYALPGGTQRHGESLVETTKREVAEETGAQVRVGRLRFVRECRGSPESRSIPADLHQIELFFDCELNSQCGMAVEPDPGQAGAEWLTLVELRSRCFFSVALLDALSDGQEFGYLGTVSSLAAAAEYYCRVHVTNRHAPDCAAARFSRSAANLRIAGFHAAAPTNREIQANFDGTKA
jgi:ADP-ribose pyrophosphatase YjhB (NUDIX family)